jgi:hypothetical protein
MPHLKMRLSALMLFAVVVGSFNYARAATLVTNGDFETGDFTGWTQIGNTGFTGVGCGTSQSVHSGNCSAFFGPRSPGGGISQNLATTPGATYQVTFWFQSDGLMPSDFSATFGGVTLTSLTDPPFSDGFDGFFFSATATAANTTLAFNFRDDPGFLGFDDVSVNQTPLPAALPLFASGGAMLGFLGWRKKRKAAAVA